MRCGLSSAALALALVACGGAGPGNPAGDEGTAAGNAAGPAGNAAAAAPSTAATGRQYVELAGASDLYEIESARLAQQQARRPELRAFAAMLLADHRRSTVELTRAAAQARPPIRLTPVLNGAQQSDLEVLRRAGGVFDQIWIRQQVTAHERALTLVTAYATSGESEPLRRQAAGVAEPIRRHLARARQLEVPAPRAR